MPEEKNGAGFTCLQLVERHGDFHRFIPEQLHGILETLQVEKTAKGKL